MRVHIPLRMKLRRLFAANCRRQLRQHLAQQAALPQQIQSSGGMRWAKDFQQLIANPLRAHLRDGRRVFAHSGERGRFNFKTKLRGKAHGAQHPQPVLAEPLRRITDRPDASGLKIRLPPDPVVQLLHDRVEKQTVHREVAAQGILPSVGEAHAAGPPSIGIIGLGAEGGHLIFVPVLQHHHHPKLFAHRDGFAEQPLDVVRLGIGGDVIVLRRLAKLGIAHAAAHPERLIPRLGQALGHAFGSFAEGDRLGLGDFRHGTRNNPEAILPEN